MEKFKVGQITSAFGIKGEVRVFSYMDEITRFSDMEKVYLGEGLDRHYSIEKVRYDKGMAVIKFKEVNERNTSESIKGLNLYVPRDEFDLDDDSYFVEDLMGCKVISEEGEELGTLVNIIQNTSQDVYEIARDGRKSFLVPAVKSFIKLIDLDAKTITIHVIEGLIDEV